MEHRDTETRARTWYMEWVCQSDSVMSQHNSRKCMIYPFSYNLGFLEKKKSNQHYNFKLLNIQKSQIWHTALFFFYITGRKLQYSCQISEHTQEKMQKHTNTVNRMGPLMIHNTTPFSSSSQHLKWQTEVIMLPTPFELFTTHRTISVTEQESDGHCFK